MKKRALCALVSLALCVTLAGQAAAAESSVSFVVNGITLAADVPNRVEARTTYVSYWPIVSALYPNATAEWVNGQAEVKADGLTLHIKPGAPVYRGQRPLPVRAGRSQVRGLQHHGSHPNPVPGAGRPAWSGTEPSPPSRSPLAAGPSSPVSRPTRRTWCTGSPASSMLRAAISPWTERLQWVMWCSTGWPAPGSPTASTK